MISTRNPGFEIPANSEGMHCDDSGFTSGYCSDANSVTITTATDHTIEVWTGSTSGSENVASLITVGSLGDFYAAEGSQFIELNAYEVASVYQDFNTPHPTTFIVRFSHRGRGANNSGNDVCVVYAGSEAATALTGLITVTDNKSAWGTYSTTYTVPPVQTVTRFSFAAFSSASVVLVLAIFWIIFSLRLIIQLMGLGKLLCHVPWIKQLLLQVESAALGLKILQIQQQRSI